MQETFDAIFHVLMPYLVVFAIAGLVLFFIQWRKHSAAVWGVCACVVFAILWRIAYGLKSSRYAIFLVLPTVVLGCYAVWNINELIPFISAKKIKFLRLALILALPIGLLAKSWYFDPYSNSLKELAEIAKADAGNGINATFFGVNIHDERFACYSGLRVGARLAETDEKYNELLKRLACFVDSDERRYIIAQIKNEKEDIFTNELNQLPGDFSKLGERFVDRRKKKKYVLFRHNSPCNSNMTAISETTDLPANNQFSNGNFEKVKPLPDFMRNFCVSRKMNFFAKHDVIIPEGCDVTWLGGYDRDGEVEAVNSGAIAGKYSVRMKNKSRLAMTYKISKGEYKFSALLKALKDSVLDICIYCYNPQYTENRRIATKRISGGEAIWKYEVTLPSDIFVKCQHVWFVFILEVGEILLDNVSLQKISK